MDEITLPEIPADLTNTTDLSVLRNALFATYSKLSGEDKVKTFEQRKQLFADLQRVDAEVARRAEFEAQSAELDAGLAKLTEPKVEPPKAETTEPPAEPEAPAEAPAVEPEPPAEPAVPVEPAAPEAGDGGESGNVTAITPPAPAADSTTATPSAEPVAVAAGVTQQVSMTDIAQQTTAPAPAPKPAKAKSPMLFAVSGTPGHEFGGAMTLEHMGQAIRDITEGFNGASNGGMRDVLKIKRSFDAALVAPHGTSDLTQWAVEASEGFKGVKGHVEAAVTCAPPQQLREICNRVDPNEGIARFPTIQLTSDKITWRRGLDWCDPVFATGYGTWTPAMQVDPAANPKTCAEVICRDGGECQTNPDWFCVVTDISMWRWDRPAVNDFTENLLARYNRWRNAKRIARAVEIAMDSTANLPVTLPAKFGTAARLADALLLAATDIRKRQGMSREAGMHVYLPWETPEMLMASEGYRDDLAALVLTMQRVVDFVAKHGITVEFVHDLQPGLGSPADSPIEATPSVCDLGPALDWPDMLRFLMVPTGSLVSAEAEVINVRTVYDLAMLQQNKFTLEFGEQTECMLDLCPGARVYEVPVCVNGTVGARALTDETVLCGVS